MSADANRVTEYRYNAEGKLKELIVRNSETGDQVTRWHYGTTLAESGVASNSLLRAKVYPESDDGGPGDDGPDTVYEREEYRYNRQGEVIGKKDENGTEHTYGYDARGRFVHDRVTTLGSGIDGAVRRISRSHDRAGRLEKVTSWSEAEVDAGDVVNEVLFRYNGFGQLIEDYQSHQGEVDTASTPRVSYTYADGTARHTRRLSTVYPDGREIGRYFGEAGSADDKLGRVYELRDAGAGDVALARYTRRGLSATMRIEYPQCGGENPPEMTYVKQGGEPDGPAGDQYTGQDAFNRIIDIRWLRGGTETHVDRIQYGFDRAGNRLWRKNVVAEDDWDELYGYDGLYQLPDRHRGTLNSVRTGLTGTPLEEEQFDYDPIGNWDGYLRQEDGSTVLDQSRTHNRDNEITEIDGSAATVGYDLAANMTLMPKVGDWSVGQTMTWDAWNRLVSISEDGDLVGSYAYDGLTQRVWKESIESSSVVTRRHYYYSDQWQVLEERVENEESAERQFVWGLRYIDDLILRDCDNYTPSRLYATHDQWHVIGTVDDEGEATERFAYRAFGATQVLAPDFTPRSVSVSGWETTYGAYRYDPEAKLYSVRFRYLHSGLGRWGSRDPIGERGGLNLFNFVSNDPLQYVDSLGLERCKCVCDPKKVNLAGKEWALKAAQASKEDGNKLPAKCIRPQSTGREFGGRICCNKKTKETGGTGPIPGKLEERPFGGRFLCSGLEVESKTAPECSTLGADWVLAGYYHSHPSGNLTPSGPDIGGMHTWGMKCPSFIGGGDTAIGMDPIIGTLPNKFGGSSQAPGAQPFNIGPDGTPYGTPTGPLPPIIPDPGRSQR